MKKIKTKDKKDTIIIAPTANSAIPQRVPEDDGLPEYMPPYNQDGVLRVGFRFSSAKPRAMGYVCVCAFFHLYLYIYFC